MNDIPSEMRLSGSPRRSLEQKIIRMIYRYRAKERSQPAALRPDRAAHRRFSRLKSHTLSQSRQAK